MLFPLPDNPNTATEPARGPTADPTTIFETRLNDLDRFCAKGLALLAGTPYLFLLPPPPMDQTGEILGLKRVLGLGRAGN